MSCDYSSLTAAIAAATSGDGLYITDDAPWPAPAGGFQIDGKSLSLTGVKSCGQLEEGTAVLSGDGTSSVLEISGSGTTVSLWRIRVTGGGTDGDHGGGIEIRGNVDVTLSESHVDYNESDLGGGIYFAGSTGSSLTLLDFSGVQGNNAVSGGGIYCTGETVITLASGSISVNTAVDGAGVWIGGGGAFYLHDGGLFLGVTFNEATGDGGGIYAEGASLAALMHGASVTVNEAERGGGVFLSGSGTQLFAVNAQIGGNSAGGDGGGIYAEADAAVVFGGHSSQDDVGRGCRLDFPRCALLTNNAAGVVGVGAGGGSGSGGAAYATSGADVTVEQAFVELSSAAGAASAFHASGSGSLLTLAKSFVAESAGAPLVVRGDNGATVDVVHSTFTRNQDQGGVLAAPGASLWLTNSVVWESSGTVIGAAGAGTGPVIDCLLVHETSSLAAIATDVAILDPLFVDAAGGDYHLQRSSPAIDRCPVIGPFPFPETDVDGDPLEDDPSVPDHSGIADAGADEATAPLFADGFESGGTDRWSNTLGG